MMRENIFVVMILVSGKKKVLTYLKRILTLWQNLVNLMKI